MHARGRQEGEGKGWSEFGEAPASKSKTREHQGGTGSCLASFTCFAFDVSSILYPWFLPPTNQIKTNHPFWAGPGLGVSILALVGGQQTSHLLRSSHLFFSFFLLRPPPPRNNHFHFPSMLFFFWPRDGYERSSSLPLPV